MNKKLSITIGIIAILIGVFGWQIHSFSEETTDEELDDLLGEYNENLGEELADLFNPDECELDECCTAYRGAMGFVEQSWSENLTNLMDQEKAASDMVDEAYENFRTYQCWLEYICRAVEYSSYAPPETVYAEGLTSDHIGKIPGCQAPEDMGVLTTGESIKKMLEEGWDLATFIFSQGETTVNMEFPDTFFRSSGVPFFPQCMSDITNKNTQPDLITARENYEGCIAILDSKIACKGDEESLENCKSESIAFIKIENALKRNHADQKTKALENKLSSIITKMLTMELHAEQFKTKLEALDKLYECYPSSCT